MALIDYFQLELDIAQHLRDDETLQGVIVEVEVDLQFQRGRAVQIFIVRRNAPEEKQSMSAGLRVRYEIEFSLWCWSFGLEMKQIMKARDKLLSQVEIALLSNRNNLTDKIGPYWIQGGEFQTNQLDLSVGLVAGAEIELFCDKSAIGS